MLGWVGHIRLLRIPKGTRKLFLMKMSCGCVSSITVSCSRVGTRREKRAKTSSEEHVLIAHAVQKEADVKRITNAFQQESERKRQDIVHKFSTLRAVVDSTERAALSSFDANVHDMLKRLQAECKAWEVKAQQLSALIAAGQDLPGAVDFDCVSLEPNVDCVISGLDALECMIAQCWSSFTLTNTVQDDDAEIQRLSTNESTLGRLQDRLTAALTDVRKKLTETVLCQRLKSSNGMPFAGQPIAKFDIPVDVGGIAVSPNGNLVAISDTSDQIILLYSMPTGDMIRSFGTSGARPGEFDLPQGLCFSSDGSNILVAEYGNDRVQEVNLTGEHVRFIAVSKAYDVDANADVIAAVSRCFDLADGRSPRSFLSIFDNASGALIRVFHTNFLSCRGLKLSPDGARVAVFELFNKQVFTFSLTGETLSRFTIARNATGLSFMPCGDIILLCDDDKGSIFLYSHDGTVAKAVIVNAVRDAKVMCAYRDILFTASYSKLIVTV